MSNPLLPYIQQHDLNGLRRMVQTLDTQPSDTPHEWIAKAVQYCIKYTHHDEYICLLPFFLQEKLTCGALLHQLIEHDRFSMFSHTWHECEQHPKFHTLLSHIFPTIIDQIAHWENVDAVNVMQKSLTAQKISHTDLNVIFEHMFVKAAKHNNTALLMHLMAVVEPTCDDCAAIFHMIDNKNCEILKIALPYIESQGVNETFLAHAWSEGLKIDNFEIFEVLRAVCSIEKAATHLNKDEKDALEKYCALQQAQRIEQHLNTGTRTPFRKI